MVSFTSDASGKDGIGKVELGVMRQLGPHRREELRLGSTQPRFLLQAWAAGTTSLFPKTEIEGWENLQAADETAVNVAIHQSFLDIYTLFQLGRPFKFTCKTSNFFIPIIGWSMYVTGHIPLKRMDERSQLVREVVSSAPVVQIVVHIVGISP